MFWTNNDGAFDLNAQGYDPNNLNVYLLFNHNGSQPEKIKRSSTYHIE